MGKNQKPQGHHRLYTFPDKTKEYFFETKDQDRYKDLIFAVINDTQGLVHANSNVIHDPAQNEKRDIKIGGVSGYKAYLKILKDKFPGQVQVVSSGSMLSPKATMQETLFYVNYLGLDAAGLSKSDFSLPFSGDYVNKLDEGFKDANFKVVSSNLFNLEGGGDFELENILQSAIVETDALKVGYLSMLAPSMAQTFDSKKLNKVYFQPMAPKIITLANELRRKGADVVALMVAHGLDCTSQQAQAENISEYKVNFVPSNDKICDLYENELSQTLAKLPTGMVDIVFTNGVPSKVANLIGGHPVLQSFPGGEHMSWAKLVYDEQLKRVVKSKTQIMQPVQICHEFFKETEDCFVKEVLRNIELEPAKFLGEEVHIQPLPANK